MQLRIKSTGQVYHFPDRAVAEALLATGVVEEVKPPAPPKQIPQTLWSVINAQQFEDGLRPPMILARCQTCGSHCYFEGRTAHKTGLFRHNNPARGQAPAKIETLAVAGGSGRLEFQGSDRPGCDVVESVPEHIGKLFEDQWRRIPKPKDPQQQSKLEQLRADVKLMSVRAI